MEEDEDDDIYAPSDAIEIVEQSAMPAVEPEKKGNDLDDGEEEGEEIEEDTSDSVYKSSRISNSFHLLITSLGYRHYY